MPTNRTLRPNSFSNSTGWANSNLIYDNNTSTFMTGNAAGNTTTFGLADLVVTPEMSILSLVCNVMWEAGAVADVGLYVEFSNPGEGWTITKRLDDVQTSPGYITQIDLVALRATLGTERLRAWTPTSWNNTQMRIYQAGNVFTSVNIREVYFTINTNDQPKAAGTGPNAIVSTLRPNFTFTVSDADGDVISKYRMKVINLTELTRVNQDLTQAVPSYDSGEVTYNGPAGTLSIPTLSDLPSGQGYRAFLQVWDSANVSNGTTYLSTVYAFANIEVVTLAVPQRPVVTPDDTTARMAIAVQGEDNMLTFNASGAELGTTADVAPNVNCSVTVSQGNPIEGSWSFRTVHTAAGNAEVIFSGVTIPAGQLAKVSAMASVRAITQVRSFQVGVVFYDANNAVLNTVYGQSYAEHATSDAVPWTVGIVQDVSVPALAVRASLIGRIVGGAANEAHEWDALTIQPRRLINMFRNPLLNRNAFTGTNLSRTLTAYNAGGTAPTFDITALPDGLIPDGTGQKIIYPGGGQDKGFYGFIDSLNSRSYTASVWVYSDVAATWKLWVGSSSVPTQVLNTVNVAAGIWTQLKGTYPQTGASGYLTIFVTMAAATAGNGWATLYQPVDTTGLTLTDYDPTTAYLPNGWTRGGGLTTQRMTLQRRLKGTTTWTTVKTFVINQPIGTRLEDIDLSDATQATTAYDYFAQPGSLYEYRIRATGTDANGVSIASQWSVLSAGAQLTKLAKFWLKSPTDPSRNLLLAMQTKKLDKTVQKQRVTKMPLGRLHPVTVSGSRRSENFPWSSAVLPSDRAKLIALLDANESLVLQMPKRQMLVNLDGDYTESEWENDNGVDPDFAVIGGNFQEVSGLHLL